MSYFFFSFPNGHAEKGHCRKNGPNLTKYLRYILCTPDKLVEAEPYYMYSTTLYRAESYSYRGTVLD